MLHTRSTRTALKTASPAASWRPFLVGLFGFGLLLALGGMFCSRAEFQEALGAKQREITAISSSKAAQIEQWRAGLLAGQAALSPDPELADPRHEFTDAARSPRGRTGALDEHASIQQGGAAQPQSSA